MEGRPTKEKLNLLVSIVLISTAIICNQWILGRVFAHDGTANSLVLKIIVWGFQLVVVAIGINIFLNRRKIGLKEYVFGFITFFLLVGFTLAFDFVLGLFGLPSKITGQYVHPPYFKETMKSIGEFAVEFKTNSQGLRYKEIPVRKNNPHEKRIVVVGDSFTEGVGVELEETFSSILESHFSSPRETIRFINAGLSGRGPLQYMNALFRVGVKYDIDGVLVCLYANDLYDTTAKIDFAPTLADRQVRRHAVEHLLHYLWPRIYTLIKSRLSEHPRVKRHKCKRDLIQDVSTEARKRGIPESRIKDWSSRLPMRLVNAVNRRELNGAIFSTGLLNPDFLTNCLDIESSVAKQKWRNMKSILDLIAHECKKRGIEIGVIFMPAPFQHNSNFYNETSIRIQVGIHVRKSWLTDTTTVQRYLHEWAKINKVPFLDLTGAFRSAESSYAEDINYPLDGHWTSLGHAIAADAMANWISGQKIFTALK